MLYISNLEEIILQRHNIISSDELVIISGYVGPRPVEKLLTLPIRSKVIYGMYGAEGIKTDLHNSLLNIQNRGKNKLNIFYSQIPVHTKCYAWFLKGKLIYALIGSANFSNSGLNYPLKEILAETTIDTFLPLSDYIDKIKNNSISCIELNILETYQEVPKECYLSLLANNGEVQNAAGLNWGQNPNNHTTPSDAYIKITRKNINDFPELFPPKQTKPLIEDSRGKKHRHNDPIEIIWDDGTIMDGLLFGNQNINNIVYPKQVSSFPHANILGQYFHKRLNVPIEQPIRRFHLEKYGRIDVGVSLQNKGIYKFDFSPKNINKN